MVINKDALLLAACLLAVSGSAQGCQWATEADAERAQARLRSMAPGVEVAFNRSAAVVRGKVLNADTSGARRWQVTIEVTEVFKGPARPLVVHTRPFTSCENGIQMATGVEGIFFVAPDGSADPESQPLGLSLERPADIEKLRILSRRR